MAKMVKPTFKQRLCNFGENVPNIAKAQVFQENNTPAKVANQTFEEPDALIGQVRICGN